MNKHRKQGGLIFEKCLPLCAMSPSSIVIHRDIFAAVGGFDESLPACEDYDLWLRITARYAVAFVEDICINKYGGHSDQLSQQHWGMDRFRVIALQKLLDDDNHESFLTAEYRQLTLSTLIKKLTILGNGAAKRGNTELSNYCAQALQRWSSEHSV